MAFERELQRIAERVDRFLETHLPPEDRFPPTIHRAVRYSVLAGGKRIRPVLCLKAQQYCGDHRAGGWWVASALELLHTYSLIHDDLPCMDNDDLRRGRPTSHKVFGEGIAVLAGDALHALAFEWLAKAGNPQVLDEVAHAIGTAGMIGGQVADLEAENQDVTPELLSWIHSAKTGALLTTSLRVGALYAGAKGRDLQALTDYGERIGLAFQIVDDILDETSTPEQLGKSPGKDRAAKKATYVRLYGVEKSQQMARSLVEEAKGRLPFRRGAGEFFYALADFIVSRAH